MASIEEQPPGQLARSNRVDAGVYRFGPATLAALRDTRAVGELGPTTTLRQLLDDRPVRPYRYRGRWLDVSTSWGRLDVSSRVIDAPRDAVDGSATVDEGVHAATAAVVGDDSTVGGDVTVAPARRARSSSFQATSRSSSRRWTGSAPSWR